MLFYRVVFILFFTACPLFAGSNQSKILVKEIENLDPTETLPASEESFYGFPDEIIAGIFTHVLQEDRPKLRLLSRKMKGLSEDPLVLGPIRAKLMKKIEAEKNQTLKNFLNSIFKIHRPYRFIVLTHKLLARKDKDVISQDLIRALNTLSLEEKNTRQEKRLAEKHLAESKLAFLYFLTAGLLDESQRGKVFNVYFPLFQKNIPSFMNAVKNALFNEGLLSVFDENETVDHIEFHLKVEERARILTALLRTALHYGDMFEERLTELVVLKPLIVEHFSGQANIALLYETCLLSDLRPSAFKSFLLAFNEHSDDVKFDYVKLANLVAKKGDKVKAIADVVAMMNKLGSVKGFPSEFEKNQHLQIIEGLPWSLHERRNFIEDIFSDEEFLILCTASGGFMEYVLPRLAISKKSAEETARLVKLAVDCGPKCLNDSTGPEDDFYGMVFKLGPLIDFEASYEFLRCIVR